MKEDHKQQMVNILIEELKEIGCEVFQGGSRRFGWHNENSDWDLFALMPPEDTLQQLLYDSDSAGYRMTFVEFLAKEIPGIRPILGGHEYDSRLAGQVSFIDIAHVTFFQDEIAFRELQREHDQLEEYLRENPELLELMINKKNNSNEIYPGVYVYRLVVSKMKYDTNQHIDGFDKYLLTRELGLSLDDIEEMMYAGNDA